jgi:hypothetical protein
VEPENRDKVTLEPEEKRPGESPTRTVWHRKKKDQESLAPEEKRPRESGTGREKSRRFGTGRKCTREA